MKEEKKFNAEIIHRFLDGDLVSDEQEALMDQVRRDPVLKEEFEGLAGAVRAIETSERIPAPSFFTAEVMRRIPPKKAAFGARVRDFMLKGRVLRWNMATALAAAVLFALIFTQIARTPNRPVETATVRQEQAVTVTMNLYAPEAHTVAVAGTFNKWKTDADVLTRQDNGVWTISIPLKPGEYSYMFIVDGEAWTTDPNAESYRDDGFGNKNAVVRVGI